MAIDILSVTLTVKSAVHYIFYICWETGESSFLNAQHSLFQDRNTLGELEGNE